MGGYVPSSSLHNIFNNNSNTLNWRKKKPQASDPFLISPWSFKYSAIRHPLKPLCASNRAATSCSRASLKPTKPGIGLAFRTRIWSEKSRLVTLSSLILQVFFNFGARVPQRARKFKKVQEKNSWNQINQFHKKFLDKNPFFAISKMAKNQFLNWEKV